ncbi:HupE / UreJ protein [Mucilaginibacter pineti]|uniref:HupE / UreJ protein n=1 Tax=Mucilaginibacter pineti TaxID=1391627 RepID=A0A1G6Z7N1_9SPHI|nr:HupE / UreJ protein [Mucilaginibacter pineti]
MQATTISLTSDKVFLELRLTPGTDVAARIIKAIDLNGDQQFSEGEKRAYLNKLNRDVSLAMDGHTAWLKLVSSTFSNVEDLKEGIGDVIIDYEADITTPGFAHQLIFKNQHYSSIAVYMVNTLLPVDTAIQVNSQTRSNDQSVYQLDFTNGGKPFTLVTEQLSTSDQWAAVKTYFVHGIKHILTGYDHLLFLCALVLGAASLWDLIKIVTAFTIAHSITLTLATFGLAHLPERIVEPVIAASIVFVAVQNIRWPKQSNGNSRLAVAFFFGLFHGLGFAGGLLELMHAMPVTMIWFALLGFSLGVEAGNQLVLLPLYGLTQLLRNKTHNRKTSAWTKIPKYVSCAVAVAGIYYFFVALSN